MPIGIGAAILGSGLLGAGASIFGSGAQVAEEQAAINKMYQMYQQGLGVQSGYVNQAQSALSPYITAGQNPLALYNYGIGAGGLPSGVTAPGGLTSGSLVAPFTAASLASTPGYQFTLGQGLKSTQNSYAAEGLGSSGAALKGAAQYSTGLAQNTYNQQFQNYLQQNQQIGNLLLGSAGIGAGAASALGGIYGSAGNAALGATTQTGANIGSATAAIGNALAGGAAGVANAGSSAVNSYLQYSLLQNLLNGGLGGQVAGYNANVGATNDALSNYFANANISSGALSNPFTNQNLDYGIG